MKLSSDSLDQTNQIAKSLVTSLKRGSVLALYGDLGSGKTTFTKFLAQSLGITKSVTSPTFILMRQYPLLGGQGTFFHLDLYRIETAEDVATINLEEIISENINIVVIEWPEKIESILPNHTIKIYFKTMSETERSITIFNS